MCVCRICVSRGVWVGCVWERVCVGKGSPISRPALLWVWSFSKIIIDSHAHQQIMIIVLITKLFSNVSYRGWGDCEAFLNNI